MNGSNRRERWFRCYKSSQKILLVGEGDFSFAACLARAFRTAENMVATSYLDEDGLVEKHWTSVPHLDTLDRLGCLLLYEVDVYNMHTHPILRKMKFDIIIFNFPHAGHYDYLCERDLELIEMHKDLVRAYFKSARKMLNEGGEVHLSHREDPPYDSWNVVSLAREAGLMLTEKADFQKSDYPGYHNKRGGDININKTFPIVCAFTYKFTLHVPKVVDHHSKKEETHDHDDDVPKKNEVRVLEMKDEDHDHRHLNSDEVNDDLLNKDGNNDDITCVHTKNEVVGLPKKDDVCGDLEVHVLEMKNLLIEEHAKDNGVDVDHPNDVVVDDHDVFVVKMKNDVLEHDAKNDEGDKFWKKVEVHIDLDFSKDIKVNHDHRLPVEGHVLEMKDHHYQHPRNDYKVQDRPKKDELLELMMKDQDHDQQHFVNDEVDNDHLLKIDEMNNDHPNNDGANDNHDVHVLEMKENVHGHNIKNDKADHDHDHVTETKNVLKEGNIKNDANEKEEVANDLYVHVMEMMNQLHMQNTEDVNDLHKHNGYCLIDAIRDHDHDDNGDVSEMKDYAQGPDMKDAVEDNDGELLEIKDHVHDIDHG